MAPKSWFISSCIFWGDAAWGCDACLVYRTYLCFAGYYLVLIDIVILVQAIVSQNIWT